MYAETNFKTKKAFKQSVLDGNQETIYQPGPFGGGPIPDGKYCVEGPHNPKPHTWYATVIVKDGFVVSVK